MKRITYSILSRFFLLFSLASTTQLAYSAAEDVLLKSECVGRSQLDLPLDSEVAGYSFARLKKEIQTPGLQQRFEFKDGEEAGWAKLEYLGFIFTSLPLNEDEIRELKSLFIADKEKIKKEYSRSLNLADKKRMVSNLNLETRNAVAWSVGSEIVTLIKLSDILLLASLGNSNKLDENRRALDKLTSNSFSREIYAIPSEDGVCLPNAFIRDDKSQPRRIAATYRVQSHPDITISLEDSGANQHLNNDEIEKMDARKEMNDFWNQYEYSRNTQTVRSLWKLPSTRSVLLSKKNGSASFVEIKRKTGPSDFGYMAVAHNIEEKRNSSLKLLIVQRSENALNAKIKPLTESQFLDLASRISATVVQR